jgi:hypothetical protein
VKCEMNLSDLGSFVGVHVSGAETCSSSIRDLSSLVTGRANALIQHLSGRTVKGTVGWTSMNLKT